MQVGQPVPQPILTKRHNVCHPASAADTSLADFDYERNGGTRTVTVIAHYFSGCTPGRDDAPLYNRMAELYLSQGKPVAFVTSLKNGVNDAICESWATQGMGSDTPIADTCDTLTHVACPVSSCGRKEALFAVCAERRAARTADGLQNGRHSSLVAYTP